MAYDEKDLKPKDEKNPYEDLEAISKRIDKAYEVDKFHRTLFEREWFRNILFQIGQHWILFDGNRWRRKNLPAWYPRAQTNKFSEKSNDLVATIIQAGRIPIRYSPSTQDPKDIATAEIGERFREVMYSEAGIEDKQAEMAIWLILTGNVFLLSYYDPDEKYGTAAMQQQRCAQCGSAIPELELAENQGACPVCAKQGAVSTQFEPAVDPEGNDLVDEVPIGALQAEIVSPFEIRIDHRIPRMEDQRRFVRVRRYDLEYARDHWKDAATPSGNKVQIEADSGGADISQFYLDILAHATANFSGSSGTVGADAGSGKHERVTAYELFELPTEDFPQGLHAIRIGSNTQAIVHAGPLETEYGAGKRRGQKFLPLVHFGFDIVPGRFWRKTRMDDVCPLQIFRNIIEANLRLTAQRMGNAVWLKPKGSGGDIITGEPGQVLEYNPVSLGGTSFAKPERVDAALGNMQPLIILINKIDDAIERVSGTFFLQGGDCVTEETECLTRHGWTKQEDLNVNDDIYSIHPETGEGCWATVNRIYRNPDYSGPIYNVRAQTVSGLFTPGHDWLVGNEDEKERKNNGKGRPRQRPTGLHKVPMEELKTHHYIPVPEELKSEDLAIYRDIVINDDFLSFAGWVFTDGYYHFRRDERGSRLRSVAITQSCEANREKCEQIRTLLQRLGVPVREHPNGDMLEFHVSGEFAENFVALFPDKRPSIAFLSFLSGHQAQVLIGAMMAGDGSVTTHDKEGKHSSRRFTSSDETLAERFQFAATLAGWATYMSSKGRKTKAGKREWTVSLKATRRISVMRVLDKTTVQEHFHGLIWCPNTSTGNWVARNNGHVFVTGNTPPGVTAASALAYLGERAQRSMSPLLREWAKGWKRWEQQALEIARANWTDERVRLIAGRNKQWETQVFKQADLQGSVEMDIDYNGLMPKSNATDRAEVGQLIQFQVINPADPQQNYNILKLFGKTELLGTVDLDTKEATKENECFMVDDKDEMHKEPELIPLVQNSQIHIAIHADLAKTDEWKALDPQKKQRWIAHIQAHIQDSVNYQQRMLQLQQAAQMTPDMQAAAAQNGGVPNGATAPDARLNGDGTKKASPAMEPTPDIAGPATGADVGIRDITPANEQGLNAA